MKRNNSKLSKQENQVKKCSVEGCENEIWSKGLCNRHRQQVRDYGQVLPRTKFDPNEFFFEGSICKIQIYDQKNNPKCQAIIDIEDYEKAKDYKWNANPKTKMPNNNQIGSLSRFLIGMTDPKIKVDHINHNVLDNRKENLRICSNTENCRNSRIGKNNTSGYKGVSWDRSRNLWEAHITVNRKKKHLGRYSNKLEAAKSYNEAAIEYFGEFFKLNKIN